MNAECANFSWKTEYDPILNQVYYINTEDGSVSFDSPCEVHTVQKRSSSTGLLSRLSSKLSLIRSKSSNNANPCPLFKSVSRRSTGSVKSTASDSEKNKESGYQSPSLSRVPSLDEDSYTLSSVPRNMYLVEKSFNLDMEDDMISIASEESIQSFYHELPRTEIYFDHESSVYVDTLSMPHLDFEKEKERYELRQQILQELY